MTTAYAGDYGGGYVLTSILREGTITVTTSTIFAGGKVTQPAASFAAEISIGDYVALFIDTGNTYAATKGIPAVVGVTANTTPIIGRVLEEPRWARMPAATASTWATMLAAQNYRTAPVEFFGLTSAHAARTDGSSTALDVASPIKWDLSANGWGDAGTTFNGAFTFHYDANTAASTVLVGMGAYPAAVSGDNDAVGYDTIA